MKRALLAFFCFAVSPLVAGAQSTSFDGFYAGATVGGVSGSADLATTTIVTGSAYDPALGTYFQASSVPAVNATGRQRVERTFGSAAAQAGYNWRFGKVVFGVEADFGSMELQRNVTASRLYPCCGGFPPFVITQTIETDWTVTARPRVGFVTGGWLVYGTAGIAIANLEYEGTFNDFVVHPATASGSMNERAVGWTGGGGAEYAMARAWSLSAAYLYADFGINRVVTTNLTQSVPDVPPVVFPNAPMTHSAGLHAHVVRLGVNYRF